MFFILINKINIDMKIISEKYTCETKIGKVILFISFQVTITTPFQIPARIWTKIKFRNL
jgi:hypothetical protein